MIPSMSNISPAVRPVPRLLLLATAAVLAATGCGPVKGYPGPARDLAELAVVRPSPPDTRIGVIVDAVDGYAVEAEIELTVLPGDRSLRVVLVPWSLAQMNQSGGGAIAAERTEYNLEWRTPTMIEARFEAGTTYDIVGRWNQPMYELTIRRAEDGAVVATRNVPAIRNAD